MSMSEMAWAMKQEGLSAEEKLVLIYMGDSAQDGQFLMYERDSISAFACIAPEYLDRCLESLESKGKAFHRGNSMYMLGCPIDSLDRVLEPRPRGYVKKKLSSRTKLAVLLRDGAKCLRCGSADDLSVDHVIAEREGGSSLIENLQTLCRSCNSAKGRKFADYRPVALQ